MTDIWAAIPAPLAGRAQAAAAWLRDQKAAGRNITIVHHIDADGVSAAAIASKALERAGIPYVFHHVKSMDDLHILQVQEAKAQALWFCDLGSTAYMHFPDTPRLVCDHHELVRDGTEESFAHLNPLLDGGSGQEISGSGCAFLAAFALDAANAPLAVIALVGATGDRQDRPFASANRALLQIAQEQGLVRVTTDLGFFGPITRDVVKFLALGDVKVPGATGDNRSAEAFLASLDILPEGPWGPRRWTELHPPEQQAIRDALVARLLDCGLADQVPRLWREVVHLHREVAGPTQELQEFSTLLNSTARYGRGDVGLAVARGDRGAAYEEALDLRDGHRKHLAGALDAFTKRPITQLSCLQWIHLQDAVLDTVVGIVAGMALGAGLGLRRDIPLIALAWTPDGRTKASSRLSQEANGRFDLAHAMREGAAAVGGQGGGHKGAAGATLPRGREEDFIAAVQAILQMQSGGLTGTARPTSTPAATGDAARGLGTLTSNVPPTSTPLQPGASGPLSAGQTGRPGPSRQTTLS